MHKPEFTELLSRLRCRLTFDILSDEPAEV